MTLILIFGAAIGVFVQSLFVLIGIGWTLDPGTLPRSFFKIVYWLLLCVTIAFFVMLVCVIKMVGQ